MYEIDRWEGEGGLHYDLTHQERIHKILKESRIRFEENVFEGENEGQDIVVYPNNDERVLFSFTRDGFLERIDVFFS